jgi:hypothetical protein
MTKNNIAKFFILTAGILSVPALGIAGTTTATGKETKPVVEQVKESFISGDIGINVVSQYVSRGLIFENQGAILQPYADLYFKLYSGEGFVNEVTLALGIWNSFHSRKTDAGLVSGGASSTASWYEFDFTVGLPITFAKNWTFTPSYYWFLSPNDGFSTFQGVNLALAYDDTDLFGAFALHPKVQVLFELENKAGNGASTGIYYEIGIAPGLPAYGDLSVSFPITAGFGSDQFYANDASFGYVSGGVSLAYALKFIPEGFGAWTATAGYTYYYLGSDSLAGFNVPGVRDGKNNEHVFSGGLGIAF